MVFSSVEFIFLFLPVTLAGYYLLSRLNSRTPQKVFLIAASLFFYAYFHVSYLLLITASILVNYVIAWQLQKNGDGRTGKAVFTAGVLFNVGLLGYFKYYDFFVDTLNRVAGTEFTLRHILLPLGISFFTFQQLSFLVSVYKKEEQVGTPVDYAVFVTFFPQLVAGPIVLYSEMKPQFEDEARRAFQAEDFAQGLYFFVCGLFKKAVIADTVAVFADNGFAMPHLTFAAAWVTALSYTLQIYFDFSGYSDMAIGLGRMFRIDIPENFLHPYRAQGISDFWRRWHITLGRALKTYVYVPLGGSRQGETKTYRNLFLTFFVSGLWHGAAWTFVLWGVLHGLFVVIERACDGVITRIPKALRIAGTFLVVNALWVLFRAESFGQALAVYRGMVNVREPGLAMVAEVVMDGIINFPAAVDIAYGCVLLGALLGVVFLKRAEAAGRRQVVLSGKTLSIAVLLFSVALICLSRRSVFIYYNF